MTHRPALNAQDALDAIAAGGRAFVSTNSRMTVLDARTVAKFAKAKEWLLKDDGPGIRLRSGKGSVYLFAGQLRITND